MSLWDTLHEDLQNKIIKIRDDELEYDTKLLKLSNDVIREYINDYMSSKGKKITNLQKATKPKLLECFEKFNIPKIPYDIVVKDKSKVKKTEVVSKSKFEVGKFWCRYDNHFDGETMTFHLDVDIKKVTKCYIWVKVDSQRRQEEYSGKIWINKCDISEYIKFGIFTIWSYKLRPY